MKEETNRKIKLGAFALSAIALLITGLYYIGSKQNVFRSTITVSTVFNNVSGLMPGNNVRFNGINVGTVSKIYAVADTAIKVELTVEEKVAKFINNCDIVSIGNDGLLGNKLINIMPVKSKHPAGLKEGDVLASLDPLQMDDAMRTLTGTSANLKSITDDLKELSARSRSKNSLWSLLTDSALADNIKSSLVNLRLVSGQAVTMTGDIKAITGNIRMGRGSIGALITDTLIAAGIKQTIVKFEKLNDSVALISGDIAGIIKRLRRGQGSAGVLLNDTMIVHNLNQSILRIDSAASGLNDNMEALKTVWPFKKYFSKPAKQRLRKLKD